MLLAASVLVTTPASAEVFHAKDEALALAFPEGTTVEPHTVVLTDAQVEACKARQVELGSKLFTYYAGSRDGKVVGYAVIDSHVVRTLPEAFMTVLSADGVVQKVVMLAFYEPPEYGPQERWLTQFEGRRPDSEGWRVGSDVHGIGGATLTAHAMTDGVHKVLVLYDLLIRPAPAS